MGNCQAVEAATVVIQHPNGRVERGYCSLRANQVMESNPGHYVAVIITTFTHRTNSDTNSTASAPVKHLKLLRPDDTLHLGLVYRLVSFEEVLKEFASKKHVKLSKLDVAHKENSRSKRGGGGQITNTQSSSDGAAEGQEEVEESSSSRSASRSGQWRPALQSIAELEI